MNTLFITSRCATDMATNNYYSVLCDYLSHDALVNETGRFPKLLDAVYAYCRRTSCMRYQIPFI